MNHRHVSLLLVVLLLTAPWRLAAQNGLEITLPDNPLALGDEVHVQVSGRWLTGCPPQLVAAHLQGLQMRLRAKQQPSAACAGQSTEILLDTRVLAKTMRIRRAGVYRVQLDVETPDGIETHAFALLQIGPVEWRGKPEAGFWWGATKGEFTNAGPGLGFQLEVQQNQLSALLAGYDTQGEPRWWLGAGQVRGNIAALELSALRQGGGPFQDYQSPKTSVAEGMAWFELQGPANAVVWLVDRIRADGTALDVRPHSIVRFNFAASAAEGMLGRWWIGEDGGVASERAQLWVEFSKVQVELDGFSLHDSDGWYRLQCQQHAEARDAVPSSCRLYSAQASIEFEFDQIAIQQWRGQSSRGKSAVAVRIDALPADDVAH
jgi:hypothetical protein